MNLYEMKCRVVYCTELAQEEPSGNSIRSSNEAPGPNKRGAFVDQLSKQSASQRRRKLKASFINLLPSTVGV